MSKSTANAANKAELRAWARAVRAALPDASSQICAHLERFVVVSGARTVLAYHAFRAESNLERLVAALPDVTFLTTRVAAPGVLTLHAYSSATHANQYGILEPNADAPEVDPSRVDVALVPGLVFSGNGARLGYGGGFYDRLLPRLRADVPRVGVTREALLRDDVPIKAWDIAMTHLCTERGVWQAINPHSSSP
jgi:5-formyltetrahydrofolate cyclo-ligase